MNANVRNLFDLNRLHGYERPASMILVNGLAEQSESWFANRRSWSRHFDVKVPEILVYDGDSLHGRIESGGEITIDYLTRRLETYLDEFVQRPPYHLVGSSLGCQIILTYAARNPAKVAKVVLLCPSGFHGDENLPVMEGVKRSQYDTLVNSVFHKANFAGDDLVASIERKFKNRKWRKGILRTLRGTVGHSVAPLLGEVEASTLILWGEDDLILSDVKGSIDAAKALRNGRQIIIPKCGHAPQIEKARLVNKLVSHFLRGKLKDIPPVFDPSAFLVPKKGMLKGFNRLLKTT